MTDLLIIVGGTLLCWRFVIRPLCEWMGLDSFRGLRVTPKGVNSTQNESL